IRQTERDEALLELAHLEGGAHQDRDLLQRMAAPLQLLDLLADRARLLLAVPDAGDRRLVAERAVGEERLAEPTLVMGDEMRGCGEDMSGRAVVSLEPHDLRAGKILLEPKDVLDLGAAPSIDALIVVADAAEIAPSLRDEPQPQILRGVRVLILVDESIFEASVKVGEHVRVLAKEPQAFEQQIAEIDGVEDFQAVL